MGQQSLHENNDEVKDLLAEKNTVHNKNHIRLTANKKESADEDGKSKTISYFQLFRYATAWEKLLTITGAAFVSIAALGIPYNLIMFGELTQLLVDRTRDGVDTITTPTTITHMNNLFGGGAVIVNGSKADNMEALRNDSIAFGIGTVVGVLVQILFCSIGLDMINHSALKQITKLRQLFLQAVLRQDMTWYDTSKGHNFATRITEDLEKVKEGIADKLAIYIYNLAIFITCMITSFCYGWKLTLVILIGAPLIIFATAFMTKMQSSMSTKETNVYQKAGAIAEEVLSSIRTVVAFGGERKEVDRYIGELQPAETTGQMKGIYSGIGGGSMYLVIHCMYALALWYGIQLMLTDRSAFGQYTPAVLITVLVCVRLGAQNMGGATPHIEAFSIAKGAATNIFNVIERTPEIDSLAENGLRPKQITGAVRMKNVHFAYPSRPGISVLKGFTLDVEAGQTVALVGPSGSGKSTCLELFQRFYDPIKGSICFDDLNICDVNLKRLRSFIGVVGQEPVLFSCSIGENVRYGNPSATQEEIVEACKISNCHDFIMKLPMGYATLVGERGGHLSGGQKQRIAIARSLIRNPSLLLLDEATSALDPHSEKQVQSALDRASKGRTTIVIAHRLSTITNADKIIYVDEGRVIEEGTHDALVQRRGRYYDLVQANNSKQHVQETMLRDVKSKSDRSIAAESSGIDEMDSKDSGNAAEQKLGSKKHKATMWRILQLNSPEWKYNLVGSISAIVLGIAIPTSSVLFGELTHVLSIRDEAVVQTESNRLAMYFVLLGITAGLASFLQTFMFNVSGVRLTTRLRTMVFSHTMKQEMGWFDDARNGVGVLCARLSGDCASVQGACGTRLGSIINSTATIIVGVMVGFYYSWKLSIASIIPVPVVLVCSFLESRISTVGSLNEKLALEQACRIAVEAISNVKTVVSLGQETDVLNRFREELLTAERECRNKNKYRGIVYALSQTMQILGYALANTVGGLMVTNGEIQYKLVITVSNVFVSGAWMLSQALSYAPNVNVAFLSAGRLFKMLARVPKYGSADQKPLISKEANGSVKFDNAKFCYPTRNNVPVLNALSLMVPAGKTIALVGSSGCGKSTCVQLLLRYYDLNSGTIELNGKHNMDYTLESLRQEIGLVSQEPTLFDRTIAENIAYGDNRRMISMPEIIDAARKANIHEFVNALPSGYETRMGFKGAQLSGGQKQRVAIARALIRNPKILLLDEATSALDVHSEGVVQAALDVARDGRTCITIAHRLSTVRSADLICVVQGGVICEEGTHDELMKLGKIYRTLYEMQEVH